MFFQCRVDEELFIYEVFSYHQLKAENHLKLRFKKIQHNVILREKKTGKSKRKTDAELDLEKLEDTITASKLRYFEDLAGYSGVGYDYSMLIIVHVSGHMSILMRFLFHVFFLH